MINKIQSYYLDTVRLFASIYVFLYHVGTEEINGVLLFSSDIFKKTFKFQGLSAHYIVIVFFVLSGFLITMSVSKPNLSFKGFYIARLGRLYSVLFPALVVTFVIYFSLLFLNVYSPDEIVNNKYLPVSFFLNLTFLSQSFNFFAVPPINAPFWSISYEFMYYVIISVIFLIKGWRKYLVLLLVLLVAGLKVLLLFPCWLFGTALFYLVKNKKFLNNYLSITIFLATSFLIGITIMGYFNIPFQKVASSTNNYYGIRLFHSNNFIADYLFAFLFSLNMYSFFGFSKLFLKFLESKVFTKLYSITATAANCSFTLYLFHIPLLFLYSSFAYFNKNNILHSTILIFLVFITVFYIARQTEWKVTFWRGLIQKIFNASENIFTKIFVKIN